MQYWKLIGATLTLVAALSCRAAVPPGADDTEDGSLGSGAGTGRGGAGGGQADVAGLSSGAGGNGGAGGSENAGKDAASTMRSDVGALLSAADANRTPDAGTGSAVAVTTNRYDNARTGANLRETLLRPSNVTGDGFGLLFSRQYDGNPYGQPLFVPGLTINGNKRNVVFVATSTNNVYAFDADDPKAEMPLWTKQLAPPADVKIGVMPGVTGYTWCKDMFPFVGVTGTPAIDVAANRLYVVSKEGKVGGKYTNKLHALELMTGQEAMGSPVTIDASVPGTGAGSTGGMLPLDGWKHLSRPGLLLAGGALYVAFGSHCDDTPYHGWVISYDAATLARKSVFNTTANGARGGIWQSGVGLAANDNGIFFVSGNGDFNADGKALGSSVVRLKPDNTLADWFTPKNAADLNKVDADLTSGTLLIPSSTQLVAGGKESVIYLIDQMNMGRFDAVNDKITQRLRVPGGGEIHNFVFWNDRLYVWPDANGLKVYSFANGQLSAAPTATYDGRKPQHPGGIMAISANGTMAGTGILWAAILTGGDAWHDIGKGALIALDANDPTKKLWDSTTNAARDDLGNLAKFSPPTITNGKVYVATFAKVNASSPAYLRVYGLLGK